MRVRLLAPVIAALLLALVRPGMAAEPLHIHVSWEVPIGNWASIIYEKKDLMTHYGKSYVADLTHFQSTPTMITALGAGELDVADLAYSTFALAVENAGMRDLRVIADETQDGYDGYRTGDYVVLKTGPVKTIADLKGKVLATVAVGSAVDIPVRAMLLRHGLEAPRDYTVVEAAFPNMSSMLKDHKVDFMPAVPPFSFNPWLVQNARTLFTTKEAMGGPTDFIIWAAHESFIRKHRAAMVDFLEDAVRAARFFTNPKNHAEVVKIAARVAHLPAPRVGYVFTKEDSYRDPDMRPNLANMQRAIDVQRKAGFLRAPLAVKKYADLSLLKEAIARIK